MICPNCGKELIEGEVCSCTLNKPYNPEENVQESVDTSAETAVNETEQEIPAEPEAQPEEHAPVQEEPVNTEAEASSYQQTMNNGAFTQHNEQYYQPNGDAYYDPSQAANPYYADPNQQQYYAGPNQPFYIEPEPSTDYPEGYKPRKKYVAVILGYALGVFGVHNFYLGNSSKGVAQILLSTLGALLFGLGPIAVAIWAVVETTLLLTEKINADANNYKIMTFAEELARENKKQNN